MLNKKHRYKLDSMIAKELQRAKAPKQTGPMGAQKPRKDQTRHLLDQLIRKIGRSHAS